MTPKPLIHVFGEVLFDCFPDGRRVLGGAPFNVAWNLQAFGLAPQFISRVGDDLDGKEDFGTWRFSVPARSPAQTVSYPVYPTVLITEIIGKLKAITLVA